MTRKKKPDDDHIPSLIGRRVQKEFKGFGIFSGKVVSYSSVRRFYKVVYDDGDREELNLRELQLILVDAAEQPTSAPRKKRGRDTCNEVTPKRLKRDVEAKHPTSNRKSVDRNKGRPLGSRADGEQQEDPASKESGREDPKEQEKGNEPKTEPSSILGTRRNRRSDKTDDVVNARSQKAGDCSSDVDDLESEGDSDADPDESSDFEMEGVEEQDDSVSSSSSDESSELPRLKRHASKELPPLVPLPDSSCDIGVPDSLVVELFAVYSFLRSFSLVLFLSPFGLEEFIAALAIHTPSNLMDSIHLVLLQALRRHVLRLSKEGHAESKECVRQRDWNLLDNITWPSFLLVYLATHRFGKMYGQKIRSLGLLDLEYCKVSVKTKLAVLGFLCDQVMETEEIRAVMDSRELQFTSQVRQKDIVFFRKGGYFSANHEPAGMKENQGILSKEDSSQTSIRLSSSNSATEKNPIQDSNSDECVLCGMEGNLICCDGCPAAYHSRCVGISRISLPPGDWFCPECTVEKAGGEQCRRIDGLRGCHTLGMDLYGRTFLYACGHLLVLEASSFMESSYKYYDSNGVVGVLQCLDMLKPHCDKITRAIRQIWGLASSTEDTVIKEASMPLRRDENDSPIAVSVKSIGKQGSDPSIVKLEANLPVELQHSEDKQLVSPQKKLDGVDSNTVSLKRENCSNPFSDTKLSELALSTTNKNFQGACNLEGTASCIPQPLEVATPPPSIGEQFKQLNTQSFMHDPCSMKKKCLVDERSHHEHFKKAVSYVNRYLLGDASATAAANLTLATSDQSNLEKGFKKKKVVTTIAEQMNAFLKTPARFCWPNINKKLGEIPKERCGWCFSCLSALKRGCLMNQAFSQLAAGSASVAGGIKPTKSGGHLSSVAGYLLHMEETVHSLLQGPFENLQYRKLWRRKLEQTSVLADVKHALLDFEAHLRTVVLTEDWSKRLEDAPSFVLCGRSSSMMNEPVLKKAAKSRRAQRSGSSRQRPKSHRAAIAMLQWVRRGKLAHKVSGWATLPSKVVKRAGRHGGMKWIAGITYSEGEEVPKRSKQLAWRARVQAACTVAELALQVRSLDIQFRWADLLSKVDVISSGSNKVDENNVTDVGKPCIHAKSLKGESTLYLIDGSLIQNSTAKPNNQAVKELNPKQNKQEIWVDERQVPLSLVRDYEERERLSMQNKVAKFSILQKQHMDVKKNIRRDVFNFLCERAGFLTTTKLVISITCKHCKEKVLASMAVQCHLCREPFHKDCTITSYLEGSDETKTTCCSCLKSPPVYVAASGTAVKQRVSSTPEALKDSNMIFKSPPPKPHVIPDLTRTYDSATKNVAEKNILEGVYWKKNGMRSRMRIQNNLLLPLQGNEQVLGNPICFICHRHYNNDLLYIKCEYCPLWYHGAALGVTQDNINEVLGFKCHKCRKKAMPSCPYGMKGKTQKEDAYDCLSTQRHTSSHSGMIIKVGESFTAKKPSFIFPLGRRNLSYVPLNQQFDMPFTTALDNMDNNRFPVDSSNEKKTVLNPPVETQIDTSSAVAIDVLASENAIHLATNELAIGNTDELVVDNVSQYIQSSSNNDQQISFLQMMQEDTQETSGGEECRSIDTVVVDGVQTGSTLPKPAFSFTELLSSEDDRVEDIAGFSREFDLDGFDVFDVDTLMGTFSNLGPAEIRSEDTSPMFNDGNGEVIESVDASEFKDVPCTVCCDSSVPSDLQCFSCGAVVHQGCLVTDSAAWSWTCHGWACSSCKDRF